MSVTREKLYEEIWVEPITKVSKRYGVSDSFLVRVLQRMNVPRPPMGYWAKLAVGKSVPRPPLPEPGPGDELEWSRDGQLKRVRRATPRAPDASKPARIRRRTERPSQHHLTSGARTHFQDVRETDAGYLKPTKKLLLDLIVSKNTLERALRIANELFLFLEDRGCKVMIAPRDSGYRRAAFEEREEGGNVNSYPGLWSPYAPTVVFIGTVAIGLTLFETTEQIEMRYLNGKYIPADQVPVPKSRSWAYDHSWTTKRDMATGRMRLQAYSPYYDAEWKQLWSETKSSTLETKLKTIVRELTEAAPIIAERVAEAERRAEIRRLEWEARCERERREAEVRRRLQAMKDSRDELNAIITAWGEAKRIEGFFDEAEKQAMQLDADQRNEVLNRIRAARNQINSPDALARLLNWKTAEERLGSTIRDPP